MGSGSGHHSSSTSLPASSSGGAPRAGRSGSGDATVLGQRRSRGPARSAAADTAADEEAAAADAATLLSVSQPRPALLPPDHPSRLGSSRLSAFAQYSAEPVGSLGSDRPTAARGGGGGGRSATPTDGDWGEEQKRHSISRQNSEHSRQPDITSSSESAAVGAYEGGRDRGDAEEATSRAAQARRHSHSVGDEAGSVGVAVRPPRGDTPATNAVERLSYVPGSIPRSAVARFPENTAAALSGGQFGKDSAEGVLQHNCDG